MLRKYFMTAFTTEKSSTTVNMMVLFYELLVKNAFFIVFAVVKHFSSINSEIFLCKFNIGEMIFDIVCNNTLPHSEFQHGFLIFLITPFRRCFFDIHSFSAVWIRRKLFKWKFGEKWFLKDSMRIRLFTNMNPKMIF